MSIKVTILNKRIQNFWKQDECDAKEAIRSVYLTIY